MSKLYRCDICEKTTPESEISQDRSMAIASTYDPDWKDICIRCARIVLSESDLAGEDYEEWKARRTSDLRLSIRLKARQ